jgi:acetyl esterase/lipase
MTLLRQLKLDRRMCRTFGWSLVAAVSVLFVAVPARAQSANGLQVAATQQTSYSVITIAYANPGDSTLLADLYLPKGSGPFPAILFIHGGGWSSGDRTQLRRQAELMAEQGMVGMAIDYRLAPAHPFPAAVEDTRQAVLWLRQHAKEYHVDPARIGAVGSSAGGYLVAMLGVDPGAGTGLGSSVRAVVALNGIFDLATMPPSKMITEFVTKPCTEVPSICAEASPLSHVKAAATRFLIMHGTADQTAPYVQATVFVEALHVAGNADAKLFSVEGAPHTFWARPQWAALSDDTMAAFLHRNLDH